MNPRTNYEPTNYGVVVLPSIMIDVKGSRACAALRIRVRHEVLNYRGYEEEDT